jgi:hypothetical protein
VGVAKHLSVMVVILALLSAPSGGVLCVRHTRFVYIYINACHLMLVALCLSYSSLTVPHAIPTLLLQAEAEEQMCLPVTFVRMNDELATLKGQLFFVSKIVAPLWEPIALIFTELAHLAENLNGTKVYYEQEIAKSTASVASTGA